MELKDKLELLKFKVKTYHDGIEKCNAEIQEIEKKLYGSSKKLITATTIINEVSREYNIGAFEITGKSRKKEIVEARREVCVRLYDVGYTYARIANILGRQEHSGVLYLLKTR